jgi:recombination protein RecA
VSHPKFILRCVHADNAEGSRSIDVDLSPDQKSVLVGTLLGDGCLAMHGHHARLHVKHKAAHRSLAEFKRSIFESYLSMRLHEFDQRFGGKRYPCVQFVTRTSPVFTHWRRRFYVDGRKQVPGDIADLLTPLAIAVWFMDDGSADHCGVTIQTHSFDHAEVERLARALSEGFDIVATLRANKRRSILYIGKQQLPRFRSVVEPFILEELEYKLVPRRGLTP